MNTGSGSRCGFAEKDPPLPLLTMTEDYELVTKPALASRRGIFGSQSIADDHIGKSQVLFEFFNRLISFTKYICTIWSTLWKLLASKAAAGFWP